MREPSVEAIPLLDAAELHGSFRERDALDAAHLAVGGEQQIELALERNLEWILDEGILPGVDVGLAREPSPRRARLASAEARAMATASAAQACMPSRVSRSVEAKPQEPSRDDAHADAERFRFGERADLRHFLWRDRAGGCPSRARRRRSRRAPCAVSSASWRPVLHHRPTLRRSTDPSAGTTYAWSQPSRGT